MSLIAVPPAVPSAEIKSRRDGPSVAVLVDSENFPAAFLGRVVEAAEGIGRANIRKGFANCSSVNTQEWRSSPYAAFAVTPVHIPTTTSGKNASDIALAMAAMDIAHLRLADVVCIASSDGDFAMLAHRLRELGVSVVGFGSAKSPSAWVAACDRFEVVYTFEALVERERKAAATKPAAKAPDPSASASDKHVAPVVAAIDAWMGPDGERLLGSLGTVLKNAIQGFEPRNYDFSQLRKLVHSLPGFEVVPGPKGSPNAPRIRRTSEVAPAVGNLAAAETADAAGTAEAVASVAPGGMATPVEVGGIVITPMETVVSDAGEPAVDHGAAATPTEDVPKEGTALIAALVDEFMGEASERDYSQFGILLRQRVKGFSPSRYGFRSQRALVSSLDGFDVVTAGMAGRKPILRLLRVTGAEAADVGSDAHDAPAEVPPTAEDARSGVAPAEGRRDDVLSAAGGIVAADPAVTPRQLWGRLRARYNTLTLAELGVESVRDLVAALPEQSKATAHEPDAAAAEVAKTPRRRAPRKPKGDA